LAKQQARGLTRWSCSASWAITALSYIHADWGYVPLVVMRSGSMLMVLAAAAQFPVPFSERD
jgi:hypothetical protein